MEYTIEEIKHKISVDDVQGCAYSSLHREARGTKHRLPERRS